MSETRTRLDERAQLWEQFQAIRHTAESESRDLTTDELDQRDRLNTEITRLSRLIDDEQREQAIGGRMTEVEELDISRSGGDSPEDRSVAEYAVAYRQWVRFGNDGTTPEQRQVLQQGFAAATPEMRALGVGTGSAGGFAVPETWRDTMIETQEQIDSVRDVAEVITTQSGGEINWPTVDDTANEGAILAENTQVTEQDVVLGTAVLNAYMYSSKLVRVSIQLLQDDAFDIENRLPRWLAARIARIQNRHFTVGTGSSQPQGIVTGATVGVTAASATAIAYGELIALEHSIDRAYRNNGRYMFNDAVLEDLRQLTDADGRPLWQPSLQAGAPSVFNGREYIVNNYMATPAINAKTVLFGDFREGYLIRDVRDVQAMRLTERYADFLQVGFLSFQRADGLTQNAAAYKALAQAAV